MAPNVEENEGAAEGTTDRILEQRPPKARYLAGAIVADCTTLLGGFWIYLEYSTRARPPVLAMALACVWASFATAVLLSFRASFAFRTEMGPRPYSPPAPPREPASSLLHWDQPNARRILLGVVGTGAVSLVAVLLLPLRSLGTEPRRIAGVGAWRRGTRLQTPDGRPIHVDEIPIGSVACVVPADAPDDYLSIAVVVRLSSPPAHAGGLGLLRAFSRICTHAGCAISIFRLDKNQFACPCHASVFDARDGTVISGPASRPLARLPLDLDAEGYLIATGPLQGHVGPVVGCRALPERGRG